ncbi:hypothetical protein DB88DRAFT_469279 [Papiliotrema laurentii]|uniref:Uncharacterized protein n=1 Tax=Papiliotrema laurentii TaxID=5418 RepID=A0AAD9FIW5_PAPLA|nr:hypothetical protein DB88DRAFT_469279 [Papiliotrema laurentii]
MSAGPKPLPRSPAGLLANQLTEEPMSSPSALSSTSVSPLTHPGILRRRSTETSGGLDYYWSSLAGAGPNSSSSSLAVSPSPSNAMLSNSPALHPASAQQYGSSYSNLQLPLPQPSSPAGSEGHRSMPGAVPHRLSPHPSLPLIVTLNPVDPAGHGRQEVESPRSWSGESNYSAEGDNSGQSHYGSFRPGSLDSAPYSPVDNEPYIRQVRESITSQTTQATYHPHQEPLDEESMKTPMAPPYEDRSDRRLHAPGPLSFDKSPQRAHVVSPTLQTTPTRSAQSPAASGYTPTSGRVPFHLPTHETRSSPLTGSAAETDQPQSAPAWQSDFGQVVDERDDTLRGKGKRTTLPAAASGLALNAMLGGENDMLSPAKYARSGSASPDSRDVSPGRSPEPPPRSTLRALYSPRGSMETTRSVETMQSSASSSRDLPTIVNTVHSPDTTPDRRRDEPSRPPRSPSRTPSMSASATIDDLTQMLGGAIDAIGLIDSRDTPPPFIVEPRKDKALAPAAEVEESSPMTPTSLPSRGASLRGPAAREVRTIPSGLSLRDGHPPPLQSPTIVINHRSWPAAMLYNHIKTMKYPGDRAKAYAQSINNLARADTGLKEWCMAASSSRPPAKSTAGIRSSPYPSTLTVPGVAHMRNVSSGSEFPMRADSYTAREISQRTVDPTDAPNSLPPNLPYPQLQAQYASGALGGMKTSPSMQSVSSFSSKRSFFSGIGKKASSKKDSTSLGPPSGSISKKDVRGLPISSPSRATKSSSPHRDRVSMAAPMGPRGPRLGGSYTPPPPVHPSMADATPRASLDTGLSRISGVPGPRRSMDGATALTMGRKGSLPLRQSSVSSGTGTPSDEEVRAMGDVLPHVPKGVIRAYLARYGDQMQAIGMYLEDERRGQVMSRS